MRRSSVRVRIQISRQNNNRSTVSALAWTRHSKKLALIWDTGYYA